MAATITYTHKHYHILHDVYALMDAHNQRVLDDFNLSNSQYMLLSLVDKNGSRLTPLSEQIYVSKSHVTRMVDQLEAMGCVRRVSDKTDRRAQRVVLTEAGQALRDRAQAAQVRSLTDRLSVLSAEEQNNLVDLLEKLRNGLVSEAAP
nr:MarR family transcriptional regulator [Anaerolineae bacterium]